MSTQSNTQAGFSHRGWHYLVMLTVAVGMFLTNLGGATLWDLDEGRNSTCAWEMHLSNDFVVPTFGGQLRVDKPALLYWLQVAAYRTFGVSEFSARFPSAIAALITVLLGYELARSMFGKATAIWSGLILATSPMVIGAARFANPDSLLNTCIALNLFLVWKGRTNPTAGWYSLWGATAGLAVLAKGPVGVVLPCAILHLFMICTGRWAKLFRLAPMFWGGFFLLLVAAPWYVWVVVETHGSFMRGFIMNHNVGRYLSTMESHHGGPLYYVMVLFVGLAPWSIFLAPTIWSSFWCALRSIPERFRGTWVEKCWVRNNDASHLEAYQFLTIWAGLFVIFFTMAATKLPNYVLPTSVPLAILTGRFVYRWVHGLVPTPNWLPVGGLVGLAAMGIGLTAACLVVGGVVPMQGIKLPVMTEVLPWAGVGIGPCLAALVGSWYLWHGKRNEVALTVAFSAIAFLGPIAAGAGALFNPYKATQPLVELAGAGRTDRHIRLAQFGASHLPSLNFYCQREIDIIGSADTAIEYLSFREESVMFMPRKVWEEQVAPFAPPSAGVVAECFDLYRGGKVVAVSNRSETHAAEMKAKMQTLKASGN